MHLPATNLSTVNTFSGIKSEHLVQHVDRMIVSSDEDI